ncbi:MAG: sn-glycerol-3-phosphate ABC transporter permease UgpE [Deltaproteobacteria bacterium]|nr:sn-glycerol-3-phosphate ABC transporter permease UgpE [Deltaproteobacteria bacterium]
MAVHILLILSILMIGFPLYYAFVISTQSMEEATQTPQKLLPSTHLWDNYVTIWNRLDLGRLLLNSTIVALAVSIGKIVISIFSAFAIVFFNFRGKQIFFWMIFVTLMLPVPVRIISTYQVISQLGWVDTYWGLTIPLIASATATFLFRQFYLTIPDELVDAAKIDGSGPLRFLWSILLPNSGTNIAALFVVMFIYGWNQYLWPLMVTGSEKMRVVVVGIASTIPAGTQPPEWNLVMAVAMMALLPPVLVVLLMQRYFMHGLLETEK